MVEARQEAQDVMISSRESDYKKLGPKLDLDAEEFLTSCSPKPKPEHPAHPSESLADMNGQDDIYQLKLLGFGSLR